jgi:Ca2+-binding EF-hand superfamily protein
MNKEQFFEELQSALLTKEISDQVFDHFDENKNGQVEFKELIHALSLLVRGKPEEKLRCTYLSRLATLSDVILCL